MPPPDGEDLPAGMTKGEDLPVAGVGMDGASSTGDDAAATAPLSLPSYLARSLWMRCRSLPRYLAMSLPRSLTQNAGSFFIRLGLSA